MKLTHWVKWQPTKIWSSSFEFPCILMNSRPFVFIRGFSAAIFRMMSPSVCVCDKLAFGVVEAMPSSLAVQRVSGGGTGWLAPRLAVERPLPPGNNHSGCFTPSGSASLHAGVIGWPTPARPDALASQRVPPFHCACRFQARLVLFPSSSQETLASRYRPPATFFRHDPLHFRSARLWKCRWGMDLTRTC